MTRLETRKARIFIAEDDRGVLELIVTRLTLVGHEAGYGRDGWEALQGIQQMRPATIVPDSNMPNLDGFGVLDALRKKPPPTPIPGMVLAARNAPDAVRCAMALGARDFLAKPFDDAQRLARVARLLRSRPRIAARASWRAGRVVVSSMERVAGRTTWASTSPWPVMATNAAHPDRQNRRL